MRIRSVPPLDAAIAVSLGLAAQLLVWFGADLGVHRAVFGPRPFTAIVFLLVGFPLVFRRRTPLPVALALFVALIAQALISRHSVEGAALVLTLFVTMYSLGAYASRRSGVFGLFMMVVALTISILFDPERVTPAQRWAGAFFMVLPLLAWVAGLAVRGRRESQRLEVEAADARRAQADALADERARIARELHDVVAHHLSVVVLQSVAAQGVLAVDPERARTPLAEIERNGRASLTELRRMLEVIRADDATPFEPQPAATDLASLVEGARHAGLPVTLQVGGQPPAYSPSLSLTVYRIVQEALTNALKHSGSAPTSVDVTYGDGRARIEILDEGRTPVSWATSGHGLIGMGERVGLFGGTLETGRRTDGGGYRVLAVLPYPEPS